MQVQPLFPGEVLIKGALGYSGLFDDPVDTGLLEAVFGKLMDCMPLSDAAFLPVNFGRYFWVKC